MNTEAFVETIVEYLHDQNNIDMGYIMKYLTENYKSEDYIPEGFEMIKELGQILTLTEEIHVVEKDSKDQVEHDEAFFDSVKTIIYSIALINSRKYKIDIFKVKDEFGIDDLINKYLMKEEKENED